MYLTSTISISLVLYLLGLLLAVLFMTYQVSNEVRENVGLSIVLNDSIENEELKRLQDMLNVAVFTKEVNYVSKEQALQEHITALGEDPVAFLGYNPLSASIELKLKEGSNLYEIQKTISRQLGDDFLVLNRYEQQQDTFRIMEVEKLISYLFLSFILLIACFNVVGSLSMLIIDKRADVVTLRNLGANDGVITRIFLFEGCLISFLGALIGVVLGLTLCLIQQEFGVIALGSGASSGAFVVDAYPVSVHLGDVVLVLITVLVVGFLSVLYPVRYLSRRLLGNN